jgi:hypothetical protein
VVPASEDLRLFELRGETMGIYCKLRDVSAAGVMRNQMCVCRFGPVREVPLRYGEANRIERNWVPFEHGGALFVSYSINPHVVLEVDTSTGECVRRHVTTGAWRRPGALRGGSPWVPILTTAGPKFRHKVLRRILSFGAVNFNSIYRIRTSSSKGLQCGCRPIKFLLSFGIGDATILNDVFIIATLVVLLNQLTNLTNRPPRKRQDAMKTTINASHLVWKVPQDGIGERRQPRAWCKYLRWTQRNT